MIGLTTKQTVCLMRVAVTKEGTVIVCVQLWKPLPMHVPVQVYL